jgi:hypothetical protein
MKKLVFISMLVLGTVLNSQAQTSPCLGENCLDYAFVNGTDADWTISVGSYFSTTVPANSTVSGTFSESDAVTIPAYSKVVVLPNRDCSLITHINEPGSGNYEGPCGKPVSVCFTLDQSLLTVFFHGNENGCGN